MTPLVELVPIIARDIPWHLHFAVSLIESLERHDVLVVAKLLMDLDLSCDITKLLKRALKYLDGVGFGWIKVRTVDLIG